MILAIYFLGIDNSITQYILSIDSVLEVIVLRIRFVPFAVSFIL